MTELPHVDSFDPEETGKTVSQPRGDAAGKEDQQEERVELDLSDPQFMASAYDTYADMRAKGPVSRVRFAGGEEASKITGSSGTASSRARHSSSPITTRSSLPCSTAASR